MTRTELSESRARLETGKRNGLALQKEGRGQFGIQTSRDDRIARTSARRRVLPNETFPITNEMLVMLEEAVDQRRSAKTKTLVSFSAEQHGANGDFDARHRTGFKRRIDGNSRLESRKYFRRTSGEMRISRRKIKPDANGKSRYFATAVKLSVIDEYETMFETLGWQAGLILPRAVSEANWLVDSKNKDDSLLISSQTDGFTALLLRGDEPTVVRSRNLHGKRNAMTKFIVC